MKKIVISALAGVMALVVVGVVWRVRAARAPGSAMAEKSAAGTPHHQLWHCGMHPWIIRDEPGFCPICDMALTPIDGNQAGSSTQPAYEGAEAEEPAVTIDPTVVQNMGVRTVEVVRGPMSKTLRVVGMLKIPEPGMHDVSLKFGGWIDKLHADQEGMHVERGEMLFEVYSPQLQVAEQELIAAVKAEKALPAEAGGEERHAAQELVHAARGKLRLWDIADRDIDAIASADRPIKDVPIRSPAAGHIEDKAIVQGSAVAPMTKLLRVADHTKIWLDAEVYQDQIPLVKIGQEVDATVDGIPGEWKGRVTFIYPHLDHLTHTLKVRTTLENPDFALKPGMYASVRIVTQPIADAMQVPAEAVIDTGTRQIVFVAEGGAKGGRYVPRNVRVGLRGDGDRVQILAGLSPGELVVTSGQFLMDVESRTIEATQKLGAPAGGK